LRGSAGFSPASLFVSTDEGARTKDVEKEQSESDEMYSLGAVKVNAPAQAMAQVRKRVPAS